MPLISVILPTCDRGPLLPRAVASILGQTESDWELIVIDHNRREPPVAEQFRGGAWLADPRIRLVQPASRRNAATARNAGLAVAQGHWVTYLDDDDAYRPGKLARQHALASATGAPAVLCGACFHLQGRTRAVQCDRASWTGDDLILRARWNTPLLFHRRSDGTRFDESLPAGEDAEFAHRLLQAAGVASVPVVAEPLVDIYPQPGPRVNSNPASLRAAAARILALRPDFYSRAARRRYVLQALLAQAKLTHQPGASTALAGRLLCESRGADWRACVNAVLVSAGIFRDRWVS
jgi:hypothetical protein